MEKRKNKLGHRTNARFSIAVQNHALRASAFHGTGGLDGNTRVRTTAVVRLTEARSTANLCAKKAIK
jgi:hypothetical protein